MYYRIRNNILYLTRIHFILELHSIKICLRNHPTNRLHSTRCQDIHKYNTRHASLSSAALPPTVSPFEKKPSHKKGALLQTSFLRTEESRAAVLREPAFENMTPGEKSQYSEDWITKWQKQQRLPDHNHQNTFCITVCLQMPLTRHTLLNQKVI